MPETILIKRSIKIILKVSLKSLFLSRTRSPSPEFASRPLITAPNEIVPFISIIVNPIDIAQLGISPTNAAAAGCINFPPFINRVISTLERQ